MQIRNRRDLEVFQKNINNNDICNCLLITFHCHCLYLNPRPHTHTQTHTGTHRCAHMCLIKVLSRLSPLQKENHVWYGQITRRLFGKLDAWVLKLIFPLSWDIFLHLCMQQTCYVSCAESKGTSETSPCGSTWHRKETTMPGLPQGVCAPQQYFTLGVF